MAKGVQLFITFVIIPMLISTETVGAIRRPSANCIGVLGRPCYPTRTDQCLVWCKSVWHSSVKGNCSRRVPVPIMITCECVYTAFECPKKL
ncbi:hypothetical protein N665_1805s0006 [Sinapis alba]|nr:hypothetical protein N665_1805s0006 [Sinapis alba]